MPGQELKQLAELIDGHPLFGGNPMGGADRHGYELPGLINVAQPKN